jgi:uncharacterized protein (DUF1330 family)
MPAYLVITGSIQNAEAWTKYRKAVLPLIESFGGTHLNATGRPQLLEGATPNGRSLFLNSKQSNVFTSFGISPSISP